MRFFKFHILAAVAAVLQGVSFMFPLPQPIYYGLMAMILFFSFGKITKLNLVFILFILASIFSLLLNDIPSFFKSEQRLVIFLIISTLIGPFLVSGKLYNFRIKTFALLNVIIIILSSLSFITYLLGISFPYAANGKIAGLFVHSLTLGPFAGVSVLILFYLIYTKQRIQYFSPKILKLCFILSSLSLLISSSRTSIIAVVIALLFLFYKLNRHQIGKTFKTILSVVFLLFITSPVWFSYASGITDKFDKTDDGTLLSSREAHWTARVGEFQTSPVIGVGFGAALIDQSFSIGVNTDSGTVEPGSSWLALLSMTGIVGFILISLIFLSSLLYLFKNKKDYLGSGILGSILIFFIIHMNAEGYILAAGSLLFFYIWLLLGVIDGYKTYQQVKII